MLFRRYANPTPLMDGMLRRGRLADFVRECIEMHNTDEEEKLIWEVWLHKCFDKSFSEFRQSIGMTKDTHTEAPTKKELEDTVRQSADMLAAFNPFDEVDGDGTIPAAWKNQH